ncbi:probable flap endonuclease 1 homolog isoform X2 [Denticeps clupeoides]|uniref:probable flap endonuclease 1 homolog isoform X2 n=1 Tax=Denticeps clupeoides TaxID=299321 RepID=UPI0010A4D8C4|nr:probable flap endonuclease 1 homolog isoform X2 [Denticeps clupeoides]
MGITKLTDLIRIDAPSAISHKVIGDYTGKVIALDASILMHQFRAAIPSMQHLSPLTGLFFRTLTFLEHDIKPVFVFEGRPPEQKRALLEKRRQSAGFHSPECPNAAACSVSFQTQDCMNLLKLMGVPFVQAPGDGEAYCAHLLKSGSVDAVASEDMDTLAFGGTVLLRQLNAKKDSDVIEFSLPKILEELKLTQAQFIDLCILLGCDYCEKIVGLGPRRALSLIKQHCTIESVTQNVNKKIHPIPVNWQYQDARNLFLNTLHSGAPELAWKEPDEESLVQFLCGQKHVKEHRIRSRMEKFRQSRQENRKTKEEQKAAGKSKQLRIDKFFRVTRKRQCAEAAGAGKKQKTKT